jgi:lipopolysaccharide transport system permease protein
LTPTFGDTPDLQSVNSHNLISVRGMVASLWRYRGFVTTSIARDFQVRYRGSALGLLWTLLQPIGTVVVLTVVFTRIMQPRLPGADAFTYSIYLCAGIFSWGLFAEIVQRELNVFIEHGNYLKKSGFPRSSLPLIVAVTASINFLIAFAAYFVFLLSIGRFPGWVVVSIVPIVLLIIMFAVGLGILLGTANVFFRDLGAAVPILLQFWFWLTPIVYPITAVPDFVKGWLAVNPLAPLIGALQDVFTQGRPPAWGSLVGPLVVAVLACAAGAAAFRSQADNIVDEL